MNTSIRKLLSTLFERKPAQQSAHLHPQQLPTSPLAWRKHWQAQGFPWRTEPEIGLKRQQELSSRRSLVSDRASGIYPFQGMQLSRADVEWLLATHDHGRGPVDWSDEQQRQRAGLDLRGADLRGVNLAGLPLAGMLGGLSETGWLATTEEQRSTAAVHLEGASLKGAQVQGAALQT